MTVSLRNTPLLVAQAGTSTTISIASSYNSTTPAVNNLLVAVFAIQANVATTLGATPAGWQLSPINEVNASNTQTRVAVYVRNASGTAADNAPTWAGTASGGTAADCGGQVTLYIFSDSSGLPPVMGAFGVAQGTSLTIAPVTSTIAIAGSYAIASNSAYANTAAAFTWTTPTAPSTWTVVGNSSASAHYAYANFSLSAPPAGSTLTCSMAHTVATSTFEAAFVAVITPPQVYGAVRSPSAASSPADAFENSVRAGNGARLPVRGQTRGMVRRPFAQNAPASYSSQQPAGARVILQRAGSAQATAIPVPPVIPPANLTAYYPTGHPAGMRGRGFPPRGVCQTNISVPVQLIGPPVTPLQSPIRARQPLPPRGGRTQGRAGTRTAVAPSQATFYPASRPARARLVPPSVRGVCRTVIGYAVFGAGPPLTSLQRPVRARQPLPARGRAQGRAGTFTPASPAAATFYPLNRPVRARLAQPSVRGVCRTVVGYPVSGPGPSFYPLNRPVQARRPLPSRGTAQGRSGTFTQVVPAAAPFYPLRRPAGAVIRPLPLKGRSAGRNGVFAGSGPAVTPLQRPVAARRPLPARGSAQGRSGTFTPVLSVTVFYPLRHPVAAVVRPLPARGRTQGRSGAFQGTGPALTPQQRALRARLTLQQPPPKGQVRSNPGVRDQGGPAVTPLQGPVAARVRPLPPRGRAQGRAGVFTAVVQAGPPVYPLHSPVAAVIRPQPPRGRAQGHAGVFRGSGPAAKPLQHPVYAWRPGPRRGVCLTSIRPAPPVPYVQATFYPLRKPVRSRPPFPPPGRGRTTPAYVPPSIPTASFVMYCYSPRTAWETGPPQLASDWQAGASQAAWETGDLFTTWEAGAPLTAWQDGLPSQT